VTHDQEEALELADRVVIMNAGRIEQQGRPDEVFDHPATSFVMNFLGSVNIFHGRVEDGKALLGPLALDYPEHTASTPQPAAGYARPHELDLSRSDEGGGGLWAKLIEVNTTGGFVKLELNDDEARLIQVHLSRDAHDALGPTVGERLYVKPRTLRVFLTETESRAARP
jgi:sulfate transport system ATP-binding protein